MSFLPSALNVKVKKFEEIRRSAGNGGSNYDSARPGGANNPIRSCSMLLV